VCDENDAETVGFGVSPHHWYLEIARGVFGELNPDAFEFPQTVDEINDRRLLVFPFSLAAITTVFSYMAIEAFINGQFHGLWSNRSADTDEMARFRDIFDGVEQFHDLRRHSKFGDVPQRVKTFCRVMGYEPIHDAEPALWQDFLNLHEQARHFLTHMDPSAEVFGECMRQIMTETPSAKYVRIAEGIIGYLFDCSTYPRPGWVEGNVLIEKVGVVLRD